MKIRQIAGHLGVSPATVSLALKGDPRVNPSTRERVMAYCQEVGYTPSFSARNLSAGRSFTLHLVCTHDEHDSPNRFLTDFLAGATQVVSAQGYRITLSLVRNSDWHSLTPHLRDGSADGFLLLNPRETDDYHLFQEAGARLLIVGRSHTPWGERVDTDNVAVGRDIAMHLQGRGYQHPVLLGPLGLTLTTDRLSGLRALYPKLPLLNGLDMEGALAATAQAVTQGADSVIVTDDALLPGVLKGLKVCGRVSPQVGVVGMGNDLSPYLDPEVTSVDFDARQLGAVAAGRLLDMLGAEGSETSSPTFVPHRLIARESTARPPQ